MTQKRNIELSLIKRYWDNPVVVSLKDANLQLLERDYILRVLKNIKKIGVLVDIGCGDGIDTMHWRIFAKEIIGYDYSLAMLKKARQNSGGKIKLFHFDLLKDDFSHKCDVAITKRCLINLGNFDNQKKAISKIHNSLVSNGYYIMLECCREGLSGLNLMRMKIGLKPIKESSHNIYFDLKALNKFIKDYFYIEEVRYFSTYYFFTRVYNQVLDKYKFKEFDAIARSFQASLDILNDRQISPQFLMVLKKKKR